MTEQTNNSDPLKDPELQDIIMSSVIGCVAVEIAHALNIEPYVALMLFYESDTCRQLHDKSTGLYLFSEKYIAEDFLIEYKAKADGSI